jgi:hypothetical protein
MRDKAAHGRALCRARVAEELQGHRGTQIAEHLKLALGIIDRQGIELAERRFPPCIENRGQRTTRAAARP